MDRRQVKVVVHRGICPIVYGEASNPNEGVRETILRKSLANAHPAHTTAKVREDRMMPHVAEPNVIAVIA